ncbi:basic amino acid ABC transporter substrate-binding protein [Streptomyces sp. NPDC051940]|uniref:basic amino acid ABC transporter substrate-binding protein n=1 Tax=Streptomyces sp. NPDC051940 TaxID=3155675 RepID=UPI0034152855
MRTRPIVAFVAAAAAATLLASCSSTDSGAEGKGGVPLIKDGKLVNCTGLPYKPFESKEGDKVVGFDVDLMDLVAKELGVEQEIVDTPFEGIESGEVFNAGKCDLAAAGMTITDERKEKIAFSDPYFDATQALLVKKGAGITGLESLDGKTLGVQQSTTGEIYAKENAKGATLKQFEDLGLEIAALETGGVDAMINDNGVLFDYVKDNPDYEVVKEFDTGEQYGIGLKKDNDKLLKAVNDVIAKAKEDGTYDEIYKKWFGAAPQ